MNKLVILLIMVAGLTSYPLNVSPVLFIGIFSLFSVQMTEPKIKWLTLPGFRYKGLLIAAFSIALVFLIPKIRAVYIWQGFRNNDSFSYSETIHLYKALYPQLKNDGKFLTQYGEELLKGAYSCGEAFLVFNQAMQKQITLRLINNSANACKCLGKYNEAIKNYRFMSYLLPTRFTPKYEMVMLYLEARDTINARLIAKQILEMPVKIPSEEVERIRNKAKTIISNEPFTVYPSP